MKSFRINYGYLLFFALTFFVGFQPHVVKAVGGRSISWWWVGDTINPGVDAFLSFCRNHSNIVTTVIMRCGIQTCFRNQSTSKPNIKCLNNHGQGGTVSGNLSMACRQVIPELAKLGIRSELWLGEDDSIDSARYLFAHAEQTADSLLAINKQYPGIQGFNIDLETGGGDSADVDKYSKFLGTVSSRLKPLRFSADVACGASWAPLFNDCKKLSSTGVGRLMNMRTYNGISYEDWYYTLLTPALAVGRPDIISTGLGCWVDHKLYNTWPTTAVSAEQRICMLMNHSVNEVAMFVLRQGSQNPLLNFPEPFWITNLEKFITGKSCNAVVPKRTKCPAASVGPIDSWTPGGDPHCCISSSRRGPNAYCNLDCAEKECSSDPGMVWKPENYSIHPYECCQSKRPSKRL